MPTIADHVLFRPISDLDLPVLRDIYASTRIEEVAQSGWDKKQIDDFLTFQFEAQHKHYMQHYADANFDILELDGEVIGRLYLLRLRTDIRIVDIALLPKWRGKGIGAKLIADVQAEARLNGQQVSIHVEHNNPARRLYERLGFVQEEDKGVYLFLVWHL